MHFRVAQRWETSFGRFLASYPVSSLVSDLARSERTRVTSKAVYEWVAGRRIPRPPVAIAIERLSAGRITLNEIYAHRSDLRKLRRAGRQNED